MQLVSSHGCLLACFESLITPTCQHVKLVRKHMAQAEGLRDELVQIRNDLVHLGSEEKQKQCGQRTRRHDPAPPSRKGLLHASPQRLF